VEHKKEKSGSKHGTKVNTSNKRDTGRLEKRIPQELFHLQTFRLQTSLTPRENFSSVWSVGEALDDEQ